MTHTCRILVFRVGALLTAALAAILSVPATAEESVAVDPLTVIVVRHAEKVDDSRDPALSKAGLERAAALAEALENAGLDAIYASQYQRTRLTAMPTAAAAGLSVRIAPVEGDIDAWAQRLSAALAQSHEGETVLVAGHSNTVPPLVTALCKCGVDALADSDYDRIYIVMGAGGERPELVVARYGETGTAIE